MKFFNWAEGFREQPIIEDIPASVTKVEITYWVWMGVSMIIFLLGLALLFGPSSNSTQKLFGVFFALEGSIQIAILKLYVHIRLAMYRIMWDNQKRIEMEIKKSELQDM